MKEQAEFAHDVAQLILYINKKGFFCTLGEAWRPPITAQIYAKEHKSITDSLHCNRLAIDLNLFDEKGVYLSESESKDYIEIGSYWESLDAKNRWGGNFVKHGGKIADANHYERKIE